MNVLSKSFYYTTGNHKKRIQFKSKKVFLEMNFCVTGASKQQRQSNIRMRYLKRSIQVNRFIKPQEIKIFEIHINILGKSFFKTAGNHKKVIQIKSRKVSS